MRYSAFFRGLMLVGSLVFVLGCQETSSSVVEDVPTQDESVVPPPADGEASPSDETPTADPAETPTQISATAFGLAELGMTMGDLKAAMPEATFEAQSPFMADFDAIAVSQNCSNTFK